MATRNLIHGQCRCCLSTGHHQDIMKEYDCEGNRQVYINVFMECFNLFLSTNRELTTLICSSCVKKLHEASSFRTMVYDTEQQLLSKLLNKETVFVNVGEMEAEVEVKPELQLVVKKEPSDDSDDDIDTVDNDDQFNDLSKDSDEDMIDGEAELLARFPSTLRLPTRQTLVNTCAGYVNHLEMLKGKLILPTMIAKLLADHRRSICKKNIYVTEKTAHIKNASCLLQFSNATPFKSKNRAGFPCYYCRGVFDNLEKVRDHQLKVHPKSDIKRSLSRYGVESFVVYVDVTDLRCTLCDTNITNLNELKKHLVKVHNKKMYTEFADRVIPFKISTLPYECQICGFAFETFGSIERHMNVHFRNFVCSDCGTGFVTKYRLKVHTKSMHVEGNFPCEICKKVFTTHQKQKNHVDAVHKMVKRFKCPKCQERFSEYFQRQKHLVQIHGVAPLQYKCNVCDKAFDRKYTLSRHMKRDHLEERDFQCDMCLYKCFTSTELRVHMIKHNGERIFECSVCKKSYARKKTLKEHMRIHNNDRRFACAVCGQAFVQKCSLKGHIKTHHMEYSLQCR